MKGEGKFIPKDGCLIPHIKPIQLPEDALPSANEMERDYTAITISDGNILKVLYIFYLSFLLVCRADG